MKSFEPSGLSEDSLQFEKRKEDHIKVSLLKESQTRNLSGFEKLEFIHEALPDIDFKDIQIESSFLGHSVASPFFVSSMTAGHKGSIGINRTLFEAAEEKRWPIGVGSQRRQLFDKNARDEWKKLTLEFPNALVVGNLGITQLIHLSVSEIEDLVFDLKAKALFIHTNPLQEVLQDEGTPNFKGSFEALKKVAQELSIPVILKEVGSGISIQTLNRLKDIPIAAVDLSGMGGTHWGRVEGLRAQKSHLQLASQVFSDWGHSTIDLVNETREKEFSFEIWGSGGVRSGLDGAKLLALGAQNIGIAQPLLKAAMIDSNEVKKQMAQFEFELKVVLFCTGSTDIEGLRTKKVWKWKKS